MYVLYVLCMVTRFPYNGLGLDIGSFLLGEKCHHLRVTIASSCYQGSQPTLSDTKMDTISFMNSAYKQIYKKLLRYHD